MVLARWQATVVDEAGNVMPAASVEVRHETAGAPLASLFSDRSGLVGIGNPFNADGDGFAAFHAVGGAYRITATLGAVTQTWRYVGVGLAGEKDTFLNGTAYLWSDSTSDADPGAGFMRFNHATLASVTAVYLDNTNADGIDLTTYLDSLDDGGAGSERNRGIVTFQQGDQCALIATLTGSVVDGTGYRKLSITPLATFGDFADGAETSFSFSRSGVDPGIHYLFSTTTADADPGAGTFRFNNATLGSVPAIYLDNTDADGATFSTFLDSWDDGGSASNRGTIVLKQTNVALFLGTVTGSIVDGTGYRKVSVTPVATFGTFVNGRATSLQFTRAGSDAVATTSIGRRDIADITSGDTIVLGDNAKLVRILTGTGTLAFTAVATLASGFFCFIENKGTGDVTLDPNSSETIDGLSSWVLYPGGSILVQCNGTDLRSVLQSSMRKQFDSSGTFTKPGVGTWAEIEGWGAGGSGARGTGAETGGGGGGGYNSRRLLLSALGATETVTIGAGGASRTSNSDGATGGNSTFGSLLTAYGGGGGDNAGNGGGGGGGTLSAGNIPSALGGGLPGLPGFWQEDEYQGQGGDNGAGLPAWIDGGGGGDGNNAGGASVYGGGGGGGCTTAAAAAGGASSFGGPGGAGAVNGTNATAGTQPAGGGGASEGVATGNSGAGGAGRIIVTIH